MDYLSKMFAFLLSAILLFVVPSFRVAWISDQALLKQVNQDTCEFVNNVRHKGFVSKIMYEDFVRKLAETGNVYTIEMRHMHDVWDYVPSTSEPEGYETANFFDEYSEFEILKEIYENDNQKYFMNKGDSFSVCVTNKTKTATNIFLNFLTGGGDTNAIFSKFGGMITNENY